METQKTNYMIPLSIVIAGALVAGAVMYTRDGGTGTSAQNGQAQTQEIVLAPVNADRDHIRGNPDADVVLVEYSDTDCPYCQQFHNTMKQVMDQYGKDGKVAWVYRHFPIPQLHPEAPREAQALECVTEQGGNTKFWEYADILYSRQRTATDPGHDTLDKVASSIGLDAAAFTTCLTSGKYESKVNEDISSAAKSGGTGTPHNVLVLKKEAPQALFDYIASFGAQLPPDIIVVSKDKKTVRVEGAVPFDMMKSILDILTTS